jgi:aspartyl-tRNA(Asn)/glutamyl-tRNA(Gln) amidotransferase subunit B
MKNLRLVCQTVIEINQDTVEDYSRGIPSAIKFLLGQVMRATKGKADPVEAHKMLEELLR